MKTAPPPTASTASATATSRLGRDTQRRPAFSTDAQAKTSDIASATTTMRTSPPAPSASAPATTPTTGNTNTLGHRDREATTARKAHPPATKVERAAGPL